ncbi:MAG: Eco57I restriction-modification methylase domain-containing protein, partial [Chloroflexota bacterium]
IGWVYQYYNDPGERDRMRKESTAPRTSRELAVRNQFFTPRYVVEFLADNTLGRTWYEMRQGDTRLRQECRHLIWREGDVFQPFGTTSVPLGDGHHHPIPYRAPKDPRDIRVIDPACGSGHFLLYAFDLFLTIYEEAWNQPDAPPWSASEAGNTLRTDYPAIEDLRRSVPELVIRHNLHGIDIDRRAVQVAGLALWLRAQRAWQEEGVADDKRPPVRRSNLVCSEPMPGDRELLTKYLTRVDHRLQRVAEVIWVAMSRAGDAGSLLPIERILDREIGSGEYLQGLGSNVVAERTFWAGARDTLLKTLRDYAEVAGSEDGTSRRLFAEDAAHGFAYIDLCHQRFDVVLMNPPFGKMAKGYEAQARADYPASYNDILGAFVDRFLDRLHPGGLLGAITSRTCFFLSSFGRWRQTVLRDRGALTCMVDLGERVMDQAMVEAAAYCLRAGKAVGDAPVFRVLTDSERDQSVLSHVNVLRSGNSSPSVFMLDRVTLNGTGNAAIDSRPLAYWVNQDISAAMQIRNTFEPDTGIVRQGLATGDNFRFTRAWWEVQAENAEASRRRWAWFVLGGGSQPWMAPLSIVVNWSSKGMEAIATGRGNGRPSVNLYFRPGLSWTLRAVRLVPYVIPAGCIPSVSRYMVFPNTGREFEA